MKNLKIYLVAILLAVGTTVFANDTNPVKTTPENVTSQIAELLKNPEMDVEKDMMAKVTFMVNDNKELVVINVDTKNENLDAFIKSRLNYKKLDALTTGKEWIVPVRFVPEA